VEYFGSGDAIAVGAVSTVIMIYNDGSSWTVTNNAAGLSHTLRAVSMPDVLNATAVGDDGAIIRTTDGGVTWTAQAGGTSVNLYDVTFPSANVGYAVGASGTILKTTDDGINWIPLSGGSDALLDGVSFANPDIGTVVGSEGTILRTTDGGSNWIGQTSGTTRPLYAVQFVTINTGYAIGRNIVLKTTDGGATWNTVGNSYDYLEDLSFIDVNTGFIVGNLDDPVMGVVFFISTDDGGFTWSTRDAPNNVFSLARLNYWEGMAVGKSGMIRRTSDGGWTWSVVGGPPLDYFLKRMHMGGLDFWGIHNGVAVTGVDIYLNPSKTTVLRTTDGGETWSRTNLGNRLFDVAYADENTVYAVGHGWWYMDEGGVIYRSSDGGANWGQVVSYFCQPGSESCISSFHGIDFGDADHGVAIGSVVVGSSSVIVTIRSSGINRVDAGISAGFSAVSMPDAETAFVVGSGGTILKSTDSGNTWVPQVSGVSVGLSGVHFIDADNGTVVGSGGTILRTWNGGDDWYPQTSGTTDNLSKVSFSSPSVGFIIGQSGTILKTIDGGAAWTAELSPIEDLTDVHTFNQNNVTIVGGLCNILAKRDQTVPVFSATLAARLSRTFVQLEWSIDGDDQIKGFHMYRRSGSTAEYARLNHRLIPKETRTFTDRTVRPEVQYEFTLGVVFDDGSEVRSNIVTSELPPAALELSQNYPNPFNPVTSIRFFLPETQQVQLTIYDVSGRLVAILVDRVMLFGDHNVEWDARNQAGQAVSSGVYYYQLVTDKRKITRKMVLIH
jgi:photosystem II stability/assembly factor-like uncharacterized protein